MKKWTLIYITAAFLAFTGASPWEGAAAVAPEGELPATGHFVATNSFPKNTVVDITNLETGKSTRAIVANSLDSPGMLAIISSDAAELIGMRLGSVSRIRMVQPSEPIAYSRFMEGMAADTPGYDSGHVITEELYREDTYRPPVTITDRGETEPSVTSMAGPSYVLEPEWRTRDVIVDIYRYNELAQPPVEPVVEYVAEPVVEEEVEEEIEEEVVYVVEEEIEEETVYVAEPTLEEEEVEEEIEYITETPVPEEIEYVLVPADEHPPENTIYGIDPADIIPGLSATPAKEEPESLLPVVTESNFSARRITALDRGWYYVQIGAFDSPELVEDTLRQIDHSYNPVVYKDGDVWYRVLLGPLNQGESAAILQRFKSIGYKDAFVRYAR